MHPVLDPVGSTSWHNRHLAAFVRLDALLRSAPVGHPTILIIGPGAVTWLTRPWLNDSARAGTLPIRKLIGDGARYADQLLRRVPFMPLASLEPVEVERTLSMPHRLVVVDRSQRILRAVGRQLPHAFCTCVDIGRSPLPEPADAVVAFNVVCRLENPPAGLRHVADAVRPGGWLLMDDRSAANGLLERGDFRQVEAKIYQRAAGGAA